MSEYQYYEFRAIDSPLTASQREHLSSLSSRARVTSHAATFVYNYGSFHGDVEKLMVDCFDAMVQVSSWGSRRLIFRLPSVLMDMKQLGVFSISEEIDRRMTRDKKHVILEFDFHDEEQGGWAEGEGWLDDLIGLREELMQGDLRGLYMAWLKAAETVFLMGDIDADTLEPPVPDGLNTLSQPQQELVKYLEINPAMIGAAAQQSGTEPEKPTLENWIDQLSPTEQHDYLVRLSRGENNLSMFLNARLLALANLKSQIQQDVKKDGRRTISELVEASKTWNAEQKKQDQREVKLAREAQLKAMAPKENSIWKKIESFIEERKASAYESAVYLLIDLRELAEYQGDLERFKARINALSKNNTNRPALLRRMREAKLIS